MKRQKLMGRCIRRLFRSRDGVAAVEFSLILAPLMLFITGILELGLAYWASALLDGATQTTARQIRTGEIQSTSGENMTAEEMFRTNICGAMEGLIRCDASDRLDTDVRSFENFDTVDLTPPDTDEETGMVVTSFQPGTANEVILIRTYYRWELFTPGLKYLMRQHVDANGNIVVSSTVAFRNEPFPEIEEAEE